MTDAQDLPDTVLAETMEEARRIVEAWDARPKVRGRDDPQTIRFARALLDLRPADLVDTASDLDRARREGWAKGMTDTLGSIQFARRSPLRAERDGTASPSAPGVLQGKPSDELLTWAKRFVADADANSGCPPNAVSGDSLLDVCRALIASTSFRAERDAVLKALRLAVEHIHWMLAAIDQGTDSQARDGWREVRKETRKHVALLKAEGASPVPPSEARHK